MHLGFSRLMDEGIAAGCEADIGSAMTMMLIHNLLGRPGYMADPLVDTAQNLFANAHCNSPTRLDGFDKPPAEYILRAHHGGGHWVSPQVLWRIGQVFTLSRFQRPDLLIVDRAKVVCNYDSPPSAACITNTGAIVEGAEDDPAQGRRLPRPADLRRPRREAPRILPTLWHRGGAFLGPTRFFRLRTQLRRVLAQRLKQRLQARTG